MFPSLNCSCFQSNNDLNINISKPIYSHLYCQGKSLTEKTFQFPFGSDFKYQNNFRTVSIEFSDEDIFEIHSKQFDPLAMLFSETDINAQIDIHLRFNGFNHITFHKYALTSTIFQKKHQHKRLWIHLIPTRNNLSQIEIDDENSTDIENQFNFSSNCFQGLIVSQLSLYIYTRREFFPSLYTFEHIFNNTNIGELHFYGAIIRPDLSLNQTFQGLIRSLTLHQHVDTIDSYTFPYYPHVYSYTIHSNEAHLMNLSSFIYTHRNLRGLEIIRPRFEVSIDQLIPTLDSLTLDIEHLNEKTLLLARHIYNFKLGSQLRTIKPEVFNLFSHRLQHLDLSDIDLSQMTSKSRCHLIKYLSKNSQRQQQLMIIYPQTKSFNECDCTQIYLNDLQSKINNFIDLTCPKLCQLNDCQIISDYFKEKYPLNQSNLILNETFVEKNHFNQQLLSAVEIYSDPVDNDIISFLINQTSDQEKNETQRKPILIEMGNVSTLDGIQEYDDIISLSTPSLLEPSSSSPSHKPIELFSWLSFFIGVGVVLLFFFIIILIIFLIVRYRNHHNFKRVSVYV